MITTTALGRLRSAAVVVLVLGSSASPAVAHPGEGQTPYRYVVPPPGITSEGPPEAGVSTQPIGPAGFAGTTDNQMQVTLPEGAFAPRPGQSGVRVELDQLDPASLPPLPAGLEPEGNGYSVGLAYAPSGTTVEALAVPATLSVVAPAAPTAVLELVDGRWVPLAYKGFAEEAGFSSVITLNRPITLLQVYDPASAPPPDTQAAARATASPAAPVASAPAAGGRGSLPIVPLVVTGLLLIGLVVGLAATRRRSRRPRA